MTTVLFSAPNSEWAEYCELLPAALARAGVTADIVRDADAPDPSRIDYIVYAPSSQLQDFSPFTNLKAVLNLWAGVEAIAPNPSLTAPLARMVDYGLTEGMVEWCVGHALRHHLDMDRDVCRQDRKWEKHTPPLARNRRVTVLGLGELGRSVAEALRDLRFNVAGWSRTLRHIDGVTTFSGNEGLGEALAHGEILILLLPLTDDTENILGADALSRLPQGAFLINPGRGQLIDDDALLAALEDGHVGHATLDVFRTEPLPEDHPFWAHRNVTVTPHIASDTRAESAAEVVAENIRRGEAGEPFLHLVDRSAGY